MEAVTVILWLLGIYFFFALVIFYALVNNIFVFRSLRYEFVMDKADIKEGVLDKPRIKYYVVTHRGKGPDKWVILFHSWGRNAARMISRGQIYFDRGYSLLFVDAPGHGKSQWVRVITGYDTAQHAQKICEQHNITQPVVHGLSFGSICALLFAKQNKVEAVVAEALFTDFYEMYRGFFRILKIPWVIYGWIALLILRTNFEWEQYAPINILPTTNYPLFLIHGEQDNMFPVDNHYSPNLKAVGDREGVFSWIVPGAPHSRMARFDGYTQRLTEFIEYYEKT